MFLKYLGKIVQANSAVDFLGIIPNDVVENIEFRRELHDYLSRVKSFQKVFIGWCVEEPRITFKSMLWIFAPKGKAGMRNLPFITRPAQDDAILEIKSAIDNNFDLLLDKTRDEGATYLILGMYLNYFLFVPESMFLVGSRVEELVDKKGNQKALFYKILYMFNHLPLWVRPKVEQTHLHFANLDNGSVIDGESTNENFGAGDRRLSVMLDEFGRVNHLIAQNIRETLSDTTDCVIYNSTHFYGRGHPYCKTLLSGKVKVIVLPWERNPVKNEGLYKSPELNVIKLYDRKYYYNKFGLDLPETFSFSELEVDLISKGLTPKLSFIADGSDKWRSPWYDAQCKRRDPRDIAQNIDRNPIGSSDSFFDTSVTGRIRTETIRKPDFEGEIDYKLDKNDKVINWYFRKDAGRRRFKWWGKLNKDDKGLYYPDQMHNYIVCCDISMGVGASNSIADVFDVNTREEVGEFACPNTSTESFADQVVAICKWVGGCTRKAFLNWESNGPGGSFEKRIRFQGYDFVYNTTDERSTNRARRKRRGWHSNRENKYDLLLELRIALAEGLRTNPKHRSLVIHSEDALHELEDYMFYENGDIGLSDCADEESGAASAHGDRVIPKGLYVLSLAEQPKAALKEQSKNAAGSFVWRREKYVQTRKKTDDWGDNSVKNLEWTI